MQFQISVKASVLFSRGNFQITSWHSRYFSFRPFDLANVVPFNLKVQSRSGNRQTNLLNVPGLQIPSFRNKDYLRIYVCIM